MRLSDDIMRASEEATAARIGNALTLASTGRFGLLPCSRQFQLTLNLNTDAVEVQTLDCLAVTRGGFLLDVQLDTRYTNYIEKRVDIPNEMGKRELLLTINVDPKQWKETLNGFEEPIYSFDLVGVNSLIPENALPIAHLVYSEQSGGWYIDEKEFVPPCLFVSSHWKYVELMNQFIQKLSEVESKVFQVLQHGTQEVFRVFWPFVQEILIDTDKNRDLMTPMALLGNIQKYVAIFTSACHLDPYINLSDAEMFRNYAHTPYSYMNVYPMIIEGLKHCFLINEKVDKIAEKQTDKPKKNDKLEAPYIADDKLYQVCKTPVVSIPIVNNVPEATVFYSTDGSMPTNPVLNGKIKIKHSFHHNKEKEDDQEYIVKLKAIHNDSESDVRDFTVILHKDPVIGIIQI